MKTNKQTNKQNNIKLLCTEMFDRSSSALTKEKKYSKTESVSVNVIIY